MQNRRAALSTGDLPGFQPPAEPKKRHKAANRQTDGQQDVGSGWETGHQARHPGI